MWKLYPKLWIWWVISAQTVATFIKSIIYLILPTLHLFFHSEADPAKIHMDIHLNHVTIFRNWIFLWVNEFGLFIYRSKTPKRLSLGLSMWENRKSQFWRKIVELGKTIRTCNFRMMHIRHMGNVFWSLQDLEIPIYLEFRIGKPLNQAILLVRVHLFKTWVSSDIV